MDLLARLAGEFDAGREDLATEALHHILTSSDVASAALVEFANQTGAGIDDKLSFTTQDAQPDRSIPDLVGKDPAGELIFILEAKFGAGLQDTQPVAYLKKLPQDRPGVCIFVAPESRHENLWSELTRRCQDDDDITVISQEGQAGQYRVAELSNRNWLVLTSWLTMLDSLSFRLSAAKESVRIEDINQLEALCRRFEAETFSPLESWELSGTIARRKIEFEKIIDAVSDRLKRKEWASYRKTRARTGTKMYRHRFYVDGFKAHVSVAYKRWRDLRETPFWMGIKGKKGAEKDYSEVDRRLRPLRGETPPRLIETDSSYRLIPLFPPLGKEREAVIESLVAQVEEVRGLLTEHPAQERTQ